MIVHHIGKGPTSTGKGVDVMLGRRSRTWMRLRPPSAIAAAGATVGCGSRRAMQDFEFRVYDFRHAQPSVMLVLTRDEDSARTMAERTLRETNGCSHIDVWVACRYLFTVEAPKSLAGQGASRDSTVSPSSFWSAFRKSGLRFREKSTLN